MLHRCPVNSYCHSADFHASRACLRPYCDAELHKSPTNRFVAGATLWKADMVSTEVFFIFLDKERLMKRAVLLYQRTLFRRRLEASSDMSFAVNYTVEEFGSLRVSWEPTFEKLFPVLEPINALKTLQIDDSVICHWAKWQAEK